MSSTAAEIETPELEPDPAVTEHPDEPETEPQEHPDEPEPEQEPEPEPEPIDVEKAMKQLEREATRHANRVSEIMGEDAQELAVCPLCEIVTPGFVFPQAIPDEHRDAVIGWLRGGADVPAMEPEPGIEVCDVCNGHGKTLTGSLVPGNDTKPCAKCNTLGWTDPTARSSWLATHPPAAPEQTPQPFVPTVVTAPAVQPPQDTWGRPLGAPNYGRDPAFMTPDEIRNDVWIANR